MYPYRIVSARFGIYSNGANSLLSSLTMSRTHYAGGALTAGTARSELMRLISFSEVEGHLSTSNNGRTIIFDETCAHWPIRT
jgi:hypothetical protein